MNFKLITTLFIGLFSAFSANFKAENNGDKDDSVNLGSILASILPSGNANQESDKHYKHQHKKYEAKDPYSLHRMLKRSDHGYAINYRMLKLQMLHMYAEFKDKSKYKDYKHKGGKHHKIYKKMKAHLRMYLLTAGQLTYVTSPAQEPELESQNLVYPNDPAYEPETDESYVPYQPRSNHWSAIRHQQYLASLTHAYHQFVANLSNAQHMRMLESRLGRMQKCAEMKTPGAYLG